MKVMPGNAFRFLRTKIGQRFLAIFLAISLLPLALIGWFALRTSESAVRRQSLEVLRAASDGAEAQIREFLDQLNHQLRSLARNPGIQAALASHAGSRSPHAEPPPEAIQDLLRKAREVMPDVRQIWVVADDGEVVASTKPSLAGQNVSKAAFFAPAQKALFSNEFYRDPATGQPDWVMASQVLSELDHRLLGFVVFKNNPDALSDLTTGRRILAEGADTQSLRIGDTGETYIVNRNHLMITESRYLPDTILRLHVDTLPVRTAFERGQEMTGDYTDYRGIEVSGASILLRKVGWVVITEVDFSQWFSVVRHLRRGLLIVAALLAIGIVILAADSTRRVVRPIQVLHESDKALAAGDPRGATIPEDGLPRDELGDLARRRNKRIQEVFRYQRELEQQTRKAQSALAELEHISHSIMHDLRAPLRALHSYATIILDTEREHISPHSREYLERMRTAALRMDNLIRDVFTYSQVARGELSLHPVDLSALFRGILETYPALQEARDHIHISSNPPRVQGNEGALTQCFAHLLDNAVKFAQAGRPLRVEIKNEIIDGWVRISIQDNGMGIPPALHETIFDMFQKGAPGPGTGVGLAIVRKAVQRMGGRLGVYSEPGEGSRFWIELHSAI